MNPKLTATTLALFLATGLTQVASADTPPTKAVQTPPKKLATPIQGVGTSPAVKNPALPAVQRPGIRLPVGQCPDPAAQRIDFRIVSRTSQFAGSVEIVGVVKNVGAAYESRPNQQMMHLYEDSRLVKYQAFHNLAPGQEVTIRYSRTWNSSSPAEGEFPPTYKLVIVYDPDITLDGNPKNDDCAGSNNMRTRSGTGINALFH
ncbi:MAG TPA: hypothetical protein VGA00_02935 [Acidiferrobacterales bacterium]|jgi:hypothetical protein